MIEYRDVLKDIKQETYLRFFTVQARGVVPSLSLQYQWTRAKLWRKEFKHDLSSTWEEKYRPSIPFHYTFIHEHFNVLSHRERRVIELILDNKYPEEIQEFMGLSNKQYLTTRLHAIDKLKKCLPESIERQIRFTERRRTLSIRRQIINRTPVFLQFRKTLRVARTVLPI